MDVINATRESRSAFAKSISMTPNHLSVVLNNEDKIVSINMVKELAKLGVNLNWLISGIGAMWANDPETSSQLKIENEALRKNLVEAEAVIKFARTALMEKINGKEKDD